MYPSQVTLTHSSINSGAAVNVLCDSIQVGGKKTIAANPNANMGDQVEVQTVAADNLRYVMRNVHYALASTSLSGSTLTYPQMLNLWKLRNVPGQEITMRVTYGKALASTSFLPGYDGTTQAIKVVLTDFDYPVDVKDSVGGYKPVGSLTFVETG